MRLLVATVTALLLVALAAAARGRRAVPQRQADGPGAEVGDAGDRGLEPDERRRSRRSARRRPPTGALIPGTKANKTLVVTLGNFVACSPAMKKSKAPPTARLKPFAASMKSACAHLGKGAHGVANGVSTIYKQNNAKLATLQIKAAFKEFQKGSSQLAHRAQAAARDRRQGLQELARSRRGERAERTLDACPSYPRSRPGGACSTPT